MKECDIFTGWSKHTLTHLTYLNIFISPKLVVQYIHDKARTKLT